MVIGIVFYSYIRMKYFTVLVFGLLAITFATDTSDSESYYKKFHYITFFFSNN